MCTYMFRYIWFLSLSNILIHLKFLHVSTLLATSPLAFYFESLLFFGKWLKDNLYYSIMLPWVSKSTSLHVIGRRIRCNVSGWLPVTKSEFKHLSYWIYSLCVFKEYLILRFLKIFFQMIKWYLLLWACAVFCSVGFFKMVLPNNFIEFLVSSMFQSRNDFS